MTGLAGAIIVICCAAIVAIMCGLGLEYLRLRREGKRKPAKPEVSQLDEVPVIARSPLLDHDPTVWAERAAAFAEMVTGRLTDQEQAVYGAGRHRRAGLLDVRLAGWQRPTAAFKAYVKEETGRELESVGPSERIVHRRIEWTDETGWKQTELDVHIGGA